MFVPPVQEVALLELIAAEPGLSFDRLLALVRKMAYDGGTWRLHAGPASTGEWVLELCGLGDLRRQAVLPTDDADDIPAATDRLWLTPKGQERVQRENGRGLR